MFILRLPFQLEDFYKEIKVLFCSILFYSILFSTWGSKPSWAYRAAKLDHRKEVGNKNTPIFIEVHLLCIIHLP